MDKDARRLLNKIMTEAGYEKVYQFEQIDFEARAKELGLSEAELRSLLGAPRAAAPSPPPKRPRRRSK